MSRTLEFIPIAKVVANGDNPRTSTDDASLEELVASIKRHGVLMPVLVDEPVKGKYHLQAGARRLAAAKQAGLKEIPAQIGKVDDGTLTAALTENVLREDLTPLEEAAALKALQEQAGGISARELAKRLGKSNDWVSDRLRLVTLPEQVQLAIKKGDLGLHAVPAIARIADVAPKVAGEIAGYVMDGELRSSELEDSYQVKLTVDEAIDSDAETELLALKSAYVSQLPLAGSKDLAGRIKRANKVLRGYESDRIEIDQDDVDAARAFGCLFELEHRAPYDGRQSVAHYVTDADWLTDRIRLKIEDLERQAEKRSKGAVPSAATSAGGKPDEAEKERRRKEREKEARARIAARGHNLELGVKTAKAFKAPKLTLDNVKLLALLAIDGQDSGLAKRGLRYVDEALQTVETKRDGSQKVTYQSSLPDGLVSKAITQAKTPEEVVGVVLRALVCARYASEDVVAQSGRASFEPRGFSSYSGNTTAKKLLDKIAAKVVPPALKKGRR